eukprot:CAMPEP_0196216966 /NCGR_PEP_ID=MMETSP0912-20130531/33392_1 /TAXON_ID=49265 /ORGANISM="Thalassiosira rotula, Strain GSO102" /LENGTH=45 /DNA_ID= /DNA_START= /DNA_END= /DNA_ORIENTATION=
MAAGQPRPDSLPGRGAWSLVLGYNEDVSRTIAMSGFAIRAVEIEP